jgi:hypothetical protein
MCTCPTIRLIVMGSDEWKGAGFGAGDKPESWVTQCDPHSSGTHVAFNCEDRASVLAFHGADFPG